MRFLRRFFMRLSNLTTGRRADQRLREEMAEHGALQTEENLRAGTPPVEARRQAALKLGAAQAIREQHNAEQSLWRGFWDSLDQIEDYPTSVQSIRI